MKKLIKKRSLFFKITVSLTASFAILFATCLAGIEIYKHAYLIPNTHNYALKQNETSDTSLASAFYDVAANNETIFDEDSIDDFKLAKDKKIFMQDKVEQAGLSHQLYKDVCVFYNNRFYNTANDKFFLGSDAIAKLDSINRRSVIVIDSYQYFDEYIMAVGIKNQDLYCFYFLNISTLSYLTSIGIEGALTFITNKDNKVLISNDIGMVNRYLISNNSSDYVNEQGNRFYGIKSSLNVTSNFGEELYICNYLPYNYVFGTINILEIAVLVLVAITLLVVCIVALIRIRKITRPINSLSNEISSLDLDNITKEKFEIEKENKNEIEVLQSSYYQMLQRIQKLLEKQHEDFELQRKLELDIFQTQINPHFLYNVLDTIAWMAKLQKQKNIEEFTINLAKFYRLSLHKGAKYISISEEIGIIHYFLAIQLQRFPDMFTYKTETDPSIEDCMTLKLILQPFVENTIKYAFNFNYGEERNGEIYVCARKKDDKYIEFIVQDNGIGFDVDEVNKKKAINSPNGFGMKNVYERLKLEYKDDFKFKIDSVCNKGTTVSIIIPMSRPSS